MAHQKKHCLPSLPFLTIPEYDCISTVVAALSEILIIALNKRPTTHFHVPQPLTTVVDVCLKNTHTYTDICMYAVVRMLIGFVGIKLCSVLSATDNGWQRDHQHRQSHLYGSTPLCCSWSQLMPNFPIAGVTSAPTTALTPTPTTKVITSTLLVGNSIHPMPTFGCSFALAFASSTFGQR